jgi:hypothetical protein
MISGLKALSTESAARSKLLKAGLEKRCLDLAAQRLQLEIAVAKHINEKGTSPKKEELRKLTARVYGNSLDLFNKTLFTVMDCDVPLVVFFVIMLVVGSIVGFFFGGKFLGRRGGDESDDMYAHDYESVPEEDYDWYATDEDKWAEYASTDMSYV